MTSLRELQYAFAEAVLAGNALPICAEIVGNGIPPTSRIGIYRNNACEGFASTLRATFPVILRLAGDRWLRQTGEEYRRAHPSRSGNLHFVGERFGDWLEQHLEGTPYAYFADVARLEWAYQEVLVAADRALFDPATLAAVDPHRHGALHFEIHPAARLVDSHYPVLRIWKRNQPGVEPHDTLDLDAGASRVLIIRRDDHVELRELPPGDFALARAFADGCDFAGAADAALRADADLDLGASISRIVRLGVLVDFHLNDRTDPSFAASRGNQ